MLKLVGPIGSGEGASPVEKSWAKEKKNPGRFGRLDNLEVPFVVLKPPGLARPGLRTVAGFETMRINCSPPGPAIRTRVLLRPSYVAAGPSLGCGCQPGVVVVASGWTMILHFCARAQGVVGSTWWRIKIGDGRCNKVGK